MDHACICHRLRCRCRHHDRRVRRSRHIRAANISRRLYAARRATLEVVMHLGAVAALPTELGKIRNQPDSVEYEGVVDIVRLR